MHLGEKGCNASLSPWLPGANLILCCRAVRNTRYSLQVYHVPICSYLRGLTRTSRVNYTAAGAGEENGKEMEEEEEEQAGG